MVKQLPTISSAISFQRVNQLSTVILDYCFEKKYGAYACC